MNVKTKPSANPQGSKRAPKIHPQYLDGSAMSKQLQALVKIIDAIVDYEGVRPAGLPDCLRGSLNWCNSQTTLLLDAMDQEAE